MDNKKTKKINTTPYIIGFFGNVYGFVIGSMYLIQFMPSLFQPISEYKFALRWAITGLVVATIGNISCVIISSPKNFFSTIIGAVIGLTVGIGASLLHPYLYFIGIMTIFIGIIFGHYKN